MVSSYVLPLLLAPIDPDGLPIDPHGSVGERHGLNHLHPKIFIIPLPKVSFAYALFLIRRAILWTDTQAFMNHLYTTVSRETYDKGKTKCMLDSANQIVVIHVPVGHSFGNVKIQLGLR